MYLDEGKKWQTGISPVLLDVKDQLSFAEFRRAFKAFEGEIWRMPMVHSELLLVGAGCVLPVMETFHAGEISGGGGGGGGEIAASDR